MQRIQTSSAAAKIVAALAFLALGVLSAGCSSTLETGYAPRKLGSSDETRRGFYAQPFTPEAKAAKEYQHDFGDVHTSKNGY